MSDLEARVARLEQLVQQLLRELKKAEDTSGLTAQSLGLVRNAPSS